MDSSTVRIGVLVPLTPPGWTEAGRQLLAGIELAAEEVNAAGGIAGAPLELLVRDTAADPDRAVAAVTELADAGVAALAGEYHSVVARAAARRAEALRVPFLCSSAVIDDLTERPTPWVARIAPPQSRGWRIYADHLLATGHRRVAVAAQPSVYWTAGTRILRERLEPHGGTVSAVDAEADATELRAELVRLEPTAVLVLAGHPDPAVSVVSAVRAEPRLAGTLIGAPAGQPEFERWWALLGRDGAAIPFLRYLPERLDPSGARVEARLRRRLGTAPSFVAFEGHDTVAVLAAILRTHGTRPDRIAAAWPHVAVDGTRGRIDFARVPGTGVWQWARPPVQVADRDPDRPGDFRILRSGSVGVV